MGLCRIAFIVTSVSNLQIMSLTLMHARLTGQSSPGGPLCGVSWTRCYRGL